MEGPNLTLFGLHGAGVLLPTARASVQAESVTHCFGNCHSGYVGLMTSSKDLTPDETIHDSPTGWVKRHIDDYVQTEGKSGKRWKGTDTLLLTTRGRKSSKLRRSALIYTQDGPNYVVVASKGGAPQHPAWYLNLSADPNVSVQVGADHHRGKARTVTGQERARLWNQMTGIWPSYEDYQVKTDREIPVVIIEVAAAAD